MQTITTIGLDIAKSVFQVHGIDAGGQVIVRRQLKRRYVLTFFQKQRHVWSVSKPAPQRTIGHANFRHWVTPPGRIRKSSSLRAMRRRSEVETRPAREK